MAGVKIGDIIEVEITDEDGCIVWRPACVLACDPHGTSFRACINGDPDFVEEYTSDEEGREWRVPSRASIAWLTEVYEEGERHHGGRSAAQKEEEEAESR